MTLYSQSLYVYSYPIKKGTSCTYNLDAFKNKFNVLIAYSPSLSEYIASNDRVLVAFSLDNLFEKLCNSFQLEFTNGGERSYLVRSEAVDIRNAEELIFHIHLKDAKDNQPISFAAVYDESRKYYGFTDEQGDCFIKMPKSTNSHKLTIHSLSYKERDIELNNENLYQEIKIITDPVKVLPITINTIKRKLSFAKSQAITTNSDFIEKVMESSVFQKDIIRTLQLLPGVSAINDSKSNIRIRGANEEATLMILDDMPVYKADHFFGIFGAFNSWYINDISLYKNNMPVEFGGRTSGLLKMESYKEVEPFQLNVDLNLLNTGLKADIPINKNLAIKISGRSTYTNLVKSGFYDLSQRQNLESGSQSNTNNSQITSNPSFDFHDINGKIVFRKNGHRIDANLFTSNDRFEDKYGLTFKNKTLVINDELFSQVSKWSNLTSGLNYVYSDQLNEIKASIYSTSFSSTYNINSHLTRKEKNEIIRDTINILNENSIKDVGLKLSYRHKSIQNLLVGAEHIFHNNNLYIENDKNPVFEINKKGRESSFFSLLTVGKRTAFYAEPALRLTYLHSLNKTYFLPQLYLSTAISDDIILKASAGRQAQYIRLFEHENALGQKQQFFAMSNNNSVPVGIGTNFMIGIWKSFGKITLDIENYYRTLDGAILHATQMPGLRPPQPGVITSGFKLFSGQSRFYGTDISLVYEAKRYFSLFTYTLSKSENKFTELFINQYFPGSDDSRHQVKWVNTFSAGKFDFSVNYIGATGRPYLDLSSIKTPQERINLDINKYLKNLPAYHRIDVGAYYKLNFGSLKSRLGLSVFNLANRINVKYKQFVYQLPSGQNNQQGQINTILGSDVAQLERTINLSFNVTFR
ncbi:MAG: TonB-dependent receptor plug domain-containing protein [Saprospiraceae bacterium]|nr:TonB-dependent receptor plug domain-containing protein [Saprospiraceae bacterium]